MIFFFYFEILNRFSWMLKEDIVILNEYLLHGSQWSLICPKLNGRNVYDTKNRFNSLCRMNKIRKDGKDLQNQLIELLKLLSSAYHPQIPDTNIFENVVIDSDDDNSGNFNNVSFFNISIF